MNNLLESINHLKQIVNEAVIDKRFLNLGNEIEYKGKILDEYQGLKLVNIIKSQNNDNNVFYSVYQVDNGQFIIYEIEPTIELDNNKTLKLKSNVQVIKDDFIFRDMENRDGVKFDDAIMGNLMQF